MIQLRHQQPSLWEGLFAEEVAQLWKPWMRVVDTEIIRKGKAGKPNEFGKLVQLQEAENQIITHYEQRICWGRLKQE